MDIAKLHSIDPWTWTVPRAAGDARHEARLYGSRELLAAMDEKVLEQITNVARLPGLVGAALAMPDAHWGYGFPIGGVAAFDPEHGGIISAGGVGFDISCGIRCLRTNLTADDVAHKAAALADSLLDQIPAGVGVEGSLRLDADELDTLMLGGARWAVEHGYGSADDLPYIEEHGCVDGAVPANVSSLAKKRQRGEMGTLGSGNHYLEVQRVAKIYNSRAAEAFGLAEGQVVVSIHCGSRGLKSLEGQQYLGAMNAAINCALANRQILAHLARRVFTHHFRQSQLETLFDVSHNTCKAERHKVDGRERLLYVHRKGATRAFGPGHPGLPARYREVGQPVIIGGSMGTGSYILAGTTESENRAWSSASHGAGRAMSRNQALRRWRGRAVVDDLDAKGILIRSHSMRGVAEEAPGAYKDIEEVAEATERAGLARRVAELRPLVCVKG
jgi:tRNA-splicing ligase RtcB